MYSYLCGDPFGEKTAPADFIVNFAHSGTIAHRLVHTISDGRNNRDRWIFELLYTCHRNKGIIQKKSNETSTLALSLYPCYCVHVFVCVCLGDDKLIMSFA